MSSILDTACITTCFCVKKNENKLQERGSLDLFVEVMAVDYNSEYKGLLTTI